MTSVRVSLAAVFVALAVLAALLAGDVRAWRSSIAAGDAAYAETPSRASWTADARLGGAAEALLGVRDAAAVIGETTNPGPAAWWWRTWFSRRAQQFTLVYDNWRPEWQGAWMAHAPAIEIWELHVREHR